MLLLPAAVGVLLLGHLVSRLALPGEERLQRWLAPAVGLAAWLAGTHLLGRLVEGFPAVLVAVTVTLGVVGLASRWPGLLPSLPAGRRPPRTGSGTLAMLAGGSATAAAIGWVAGRSHFFDHFSLHGHWHWIAALQNGSFPLRQTLFPDRLLAYHDGFDVVAAALTAMTRISLPAAIDVVTVAAVLYSWCLAWLVGEALFGDRAGPWCALGALLGGGLGAGLAAYKLATRSALAAGDLVVDFGDLGTGLPFNPPVVAYLFQPPFVLGLPLALAALLLVVRQPRMQGWALAALGVLLVGLYTAQVIFFLALIGATSFVYLVLRRSSAYALALPLMLLAAAACGGMLFTPGGGTPPGSFRLQVWLMESPAARVLGWQALYFGALLPLGLVGVLGSRRERALMALLTLGCVAAPNLVAYGITWDMVKFFAVGSALLGLLAGGPLARLWGRGGTPPRLAAVALLALLLATPLTYLGSTAWAIGAAAPTVAGFTALEPPAVTADEGRVIAWLRRRVGPTEIVHPPAPRAAAFAVRGGLAVSWPRIDSDAFPAPADQLASRRALLESGAATADDFLAQGIRWIVTEDPGSMAGRAVTACRAAGGCREAYRSGRLAVFDLAG